MADSRLVAARIVG